MIKALDNPPVLISSMSDKPFKIYIFENEPIHFLLNWDVDDGANTHIEKLCLLLFYVSSKLEYCLIAREVLVFCKIYIS